MTRYKLKFHEETVSEHETLQDALDEMGRLQASDEKYREKSPGATPMSIQIVPEDMAGALFQQAQAMEKYNPEFKLVYFLSEVYGILGDEIRRSAKYQRLIEGILQRHYK